MSRVAFSPTFMVRTPSSQPIKFERVNQDIQESMDVDRRLTLDDLANADPGDEIPPSN
jgi:hypothetical protein